MFEFHDVNLNLQTVKHWAKTLLVSELMSLYLRGILRPDKDT